MFKKITLAFLFTGIFSLQAERNIPKFSDFNNLVQEAYDSFSKSIDAYLIVPNKIEIIQSITDKLIQGRLMLLSAKISLRAMTGGITVLAFYNNIQEIKSLKKFIEQEKYAYLIGVDIHKTEQEIKSAFNITREPTIIYFFLCKEVARNTNFNTKDVANRIDYHLNAYLQQM